MESQVNISLTYCSILFLFPSNYFCLCLFFSNDQVAEGGGQVPPPLHPPGYGHETALFALCVKWALWPSCDNNMVTDYAVNQLLWVGPTNQW